MAKAIGRVSWRFAGVVALLAAALMASRLSEYREPGRLAKPLDTIESEIDGWTASPPQSLDEVDSAVLKPTSYLLNSYRKDKKEIGLFVAFYAEQRSGESLHSPKNCLPGNGWEIWEQGKAAVPLNGGTIQVNKYSIQNGSKRLLVLYWYQSRERIIASEYLGKMLLVRDAILKGLTAGSLVRLMLADEPGALEDGTHFASLLIPQMQQCLGRRSGR